MKKFSMDRARALIMPAVACLLMPLAGRMANAADASAPNVLLIVADDCTYNDLPLYGGKNARTPNIDALAAQGLTFNKAYLAEAMCQPCRAELYSGQFPLRNGCAWNHSASRATTRSLPDFLKPLGYRVGLAGKVHVKPASSFAFEGIEGFDPNCVREPTQPHDLTGLRDFINGSGADDGPFCAVVALVDPHIPWVMGDASKYPPASLKLPPNLANTPETREHFSHYLAEITYMDSQVGEILEVLQESGKSENTLVVFTSEQGAQFPGCKWTNWDTGVHTALVARWPGKIAGGERTDALVQYADVAPTLIDLAGGDVAALEGAAGHVFDGRSFSPVLLGESATHRDFVYGVHNNLPEGPAYPVRSVSDGRYRYLRNLSPDNLYIEKHLMGGGRLNNPYWASWVGADPLKQPKVYQLVKRYMSRPAEELYLTMEDPYEMKNLASDAELSEVRARLSAELDRWMNEQADPGVAVDTPEALKAARKDNHLHGNAADGGK